MALKKKQHYIPQFYMRNFSPDGKRINRLKALTIEDLRI